MRTDHLEEMLSHHRAERRLAMVAAAVAILALAFAIVYLIGGPR